MNDDNSTDISARIAQVVDYLEVKPNKFAKDLGYSRSQSVYDILKGRSNPSFEFFNRFINTEYADIIDLVWLFTGKGEMICNPNSEKNATLSATLSPETEIRNVNFSVEEGLENYGGPMPKVITVDQHGHQNIVMIDTRASQEYSKSLANQKWIGKQPVFSIPRPEFEGKTFRGFQVVNDSMEHLLSKGDWVFARALDDYSQVRDGYVHIVVSKSNGTQIKRLYRSPSDPNRFIVKADNIAYKPESVLTGDFLEIWAARAFMSFDFSQKRDTLIDTVSDFELRMHDMESAIKGLTGN